MSQLSQHSDGPSETHKSVAATPDSAKRSQRNKVPAPSPLQTSTSAATTSPPHSVTPTRTTFSRGIFDSTSPTAPSSDSPSPRSPELSPRSTKQRLEQLLTSERDFYKSGDSSPADSVASDSSRFGRGPHLTNGAQRSVSDPVANPKSATSATSSPISPPLLMASNAMQHRTDMMAAPARTSSIDSAISAISSSAMSVKSQDSSSTMDIGNLIQASGSPEAAIQYLLKDKQSQAAQNAQLWRLVDKQRAMILGLNKDLERALKDKERYRKKLKDTLAQLSNPSPVDSIPGVSEATSSDRKASAAPSMEALVTKMRDPAHSQDQSGFPVQAAMSSHPLTPPADSAQTLPLSNLAGAEHKASSPVKHTFQQYSPIAPSTGFEAGQQQRKTSDSGSASVPPSRSLPPDPPIGPPPKAPAPRTPTSPLFPAPSLAIIEASPQAGDNLDSFPAPPPRKAPPARLDLGNKVQASSHLRQTSGAGDDSDSDYDDILEVEEIPTFTDRGRRKTREEDDKVREIAAMKEAEMRSLSKKSTKSKSRGGATPKEDTSKPALPSMGPRPTVPIAPPETFRGTSDANTGSLAGILSGASRPDSSTEKIVSVPLMSPGLPSSPRPVDRGMPAFPRTPGSTQPLGSPLASPRGMGAFPTSIPLSPRAPRQPIPLPPNTPLATTAPVAPRGEPLQIVSPPPAAAPASGTSPHSAHSGKSSISQSPIDGAEVYQGFVTDEYPGLLLPPNALPSVDVKVASSRLKPSRASIMFPKNFEEDPVFTLAVFSRADGKELWRVEKDSTSLGLLDQSLKESPSFMAKIPDKSLFNGHAPAKIDARRVALNSYLDEILNTHMDITSALHVCKYLSTNTLKPNNEDMSPSGPSTMDSPVKLGQGGRPLKNGYLTKRGKNFGGWKARFFVLDGPVLKYYEGIGGAHLGAIKLQNAQIGKQQQQSEESPSRDSDDADNQYRHAFLILEPKRKDSSSLVRHVLCAESDKERDEWVEALLQYVDFKEDEDEERYPDRNGSAPSGSATLKKKQSMPRSQPHPEVNDDLRGISYETTKQGSLPRSKVDTPSPPTNGDDHDPFALMTQAQALKSISGPKNAQLIQDAGSWGNKQPLLAPVSAEDKKQRKRSFFGFGTKSRPSTESPDRGPEASNSLTQMAVEQHGPIRPVFGAPLAEAVRYNHPADNKVGLPAVVYRCIEYLDANNAAGEEGIFRLSGSNLIIKQLRERFNTEGDVNLITDEHFYDIHAVASLLKLYLRELPTTILTRELHLDFIAVTELHEVQDKIRALNGLVHRLPTANNTLLRYLAGFLINIVTHSDINKMTVRNVGIVFSPTLNIPAPVFALFLQQYDGIFGEEPENQSPVETTIEAPPLTPEDIRSPRQQMFQSLPTPSFDQQNFPAGAHAPSFPAPQFQQQRIVQDTGFTPLQPAYEPQFQAFPQPDHGNRMSTLGAAYGNENGGPMSKSKRRESSMFGMGAGMGQRKGSNPMLRNDNVVEEEPAFD